MLSLKGPKFCTHELGGESPIIRKFTFEEKFAIKLSQVDFCSDESIKKFVHWVASAAMGEDLKIPEVSFGYQLDHRLDYNEDDPYVYFRDHINRFVSSSKDRLEVLKRC
jgi:hypothetical protein